MRHLGYPEQIVRILESLYSGTFSAVGVRADISERFETVVGVLQGRILSPLLFNIFLEVTMSWALHDLDIEAVLSGHIVHNLRFADDIAADLPSIADNIAKESTKMGMQIKIEKTEVQHVGREKRAEHKHQEIKP